MCEDSLEYLLSSRMGNSLQSFRDFHVGLLGWNGILREQI